MTLQLFSATNRVLRIVNNTNCHRESFLQFKIFRENSFSPDFEEFEFAGKKLYDDIEASDDSGHGRSTEMSGMHYTYRVFFNKRTLYKNTL